MLIAFYGKSTLVIPNPATLIQFTQKVLIQIIPFSINIVFVYTQLNVKTVLFQTIQFSVSTVSMSKQFYLKLFSST